MQTYKEAEAAQVAEAAKQAEAQSSAPQQESETPAEDSDASDSTEAESRTDAAVNEEEAEEESREEDSDDDESDDDEEEEQKPRKTKGKGRNVSRRIAKLTQQRTAAQREAEYWREKALGADRSKKTADESESTPQKTVQPGKPSEDDYETHAEYVEALVDWKAEAKLSEREAKQRESQLKAEQQQKLQAHSERVQKFAESHEDFGDLMEDVGDIPLSIAVQEAFIESDLGPQLMYELARDPEELERICKLSPARAYRAIGRIEARLESSTEPSKKPEGVKTTKAPKPLKPVGSKSGKAVPKSIYDPDLSFADYERLRAKESSF